MAIRVRLLFALLALTTVGSVAQLLKLLGPFDALQAGAPQSGAETSIMEMSALSRDRMGASEHIPLSPIRKPLEPARRNIFSRKEAAANLQIASAVETSVTRVLKEPQAVAELPPPMMWRFLGGLRSPDGAVWVYLSDGEQVQAVQAGTDLPGGYRVEKISLNPTSKPDELSISEVRLGHPSLQLDHTIRISEPELP